MSNKLVISVLNRSGKSVKDSELDDFVHKALQPQVSDDFFPAWRVDAQVMFVDKPIRNSWWLVILDETDRNRWLGYHLTIEGKPLGTVFANKTDEAGCPWTVTASHELLEMLADPENNRMICDRSFDPAHLPKFGERTASFYALEVCDPCADEGCAYDKGGRRVSDFILPAWYLKGTPTGQSFDYNKKIQHPFDRSEGGYAGVYSHQDGWQLRGLDALPFSRQKVVKNGRLSRRMLPRTKVKTVDASMIC
jgi:hypothetical protein